MRLIGARFPASAAANGALADLLALLDLAADDAAVRSLGSTSYEGPTPTDVLLAGRFREDRLVTVRATIARHGGAIVADGQE
jgi:hypothetical protein